MPYITSESKSVEHSWEPRYKYAQSAKAHREVMDHARADAVITLALTVVVLLVFVVSVYYAFSTMPIG